MRRLLALILSLIASANVAFAAFPTPTGRVTDAANVLSDDIHAAAERIRAAEASTGTEIGVVTAPSLDGMSIEEYASRLFAEWGIGRRGQN